MIDIRQHGSIFSGAGSGFQSTGSFFPLDNINLIATGNSRSSAFRNTVTSNNAQIRSNKDGSLIANVSLGFLLSQYNTVIKDRVYLINSSNNNLSVYDIQTLQLIQTFNNTNGRYVEITESGNICVLGPYFNGSSQVTRYKEITNDGNVLYDKNYPTSLNVVRGSSNNGIFCVLNGSQLSFYNGRLTNNNPLITLNLNQALTYYTYKDEFYYCENTNSFSLTIKKINSSGVITNLKVIEINNITGQNSPIMYIFKDRIYFTSDYTVGTLVMDLQGNTLKRIFGNSTASYVYEGMNNSLGFSASNLKYGYKIKV